MRLDLLGISVVILDVDNIFYLNPMDGNKLNFVAVTNQLLIALGAQNK